MVVRILTASGLTALLTIGGCFGMGGEELAKIEPEAAPLEPDYDADIAPLMDRFCVTCHSADAPGIQRATPFLTNETGVQRASCRALDRAVTEQSMPPGAMPRLSGVDRLTFERWVIDLWDGSVPDCDERLEQ